MKVFTYFEPVPSMTPDNQLHRLWRESWMRHGWEPVMLGRADALAANADVVAEIEASKELQRGPCPAGYNLACHVRWVAHWPEGGLMVDYDVINRGFTPDDLAGCEYPGRACFLSGSNCPCVVYADSAGVATMLQAILDHARQVDEGEYDPKVFPGELGFVAHDQAIFDRFSFRFRYPRRPLVVDYRPDSDEWRHAALAHFPNGQTPKPRGDFIARNNLLA